MAVILHIFKKQLSILYLYYFTRNVNKMNGVICAFNNFDKDLMMLVVFGLRGTKHELEAQYALRCASIIKREISVMKNVNSVSIGITTGN